MRVLCVNCRPGDLGAQIDDYIFRQKGELGDIVQAQADLTRFEVFASSAMSSDWVSVNEAEIIGFLRQLPTEDRSRVYERLVDFFAHLGTRGIIVHPSFLMNDPSPLQMANAS